MHSFHKTNQVQGFDLDQNEQRNSEEKTQSALNPTDSLLEGADVNYSVDTCSKVTWDLSRLPQDKNAEEHEDTQLSPCTKTEVQDQITGPVLNLSNQEASLIQSAATSNQFSPDAQENFFVPLSSVLSVPSVGSNPLSPFISKKASLEEEKVVSNLIQFGDMLKSDNKEVHVDTSAVPTEGGINATPSEEVQPTAEARHALEKEMKLSSARQPSLESDQSALVFISDFYLVDNRVASSVY